MYIYKQNLIVSKDFQYIFEINDDNMYRKKVEKKSTTILYFFKQLSKILYDNIDKQYYDNLILLFKMSNEKFCNYK